MPRKKINEDEKMNIAKSSSVENAKKVVEKKGKESVVKKTNTVKDGKSVGNKKAVQSGNLKSGVKEEKEKKTTSSKSLTKKENKVVSKSEEKKTLPKAKEKKELPKPEEKKSLPKAKEKKELPKPEEKKVLPKVKEKKELPKPEEKKVLPKAKEKKELPKPEEKKVLPKTKEKKEVVKSEETSKNKVNKEVTKKEEKKSLPKSKNKKIVTKELTEEEKDKKLLEKIKEFFVKNPEQASKLDADMDEEQEYLPEYYDLPYRYNETVVKILAQTPKRLFIYWDISDNDIQKYRRAFGEDFFEKTYPVLLVHNEEMNYTYEVPINDFANSWYLDINDAKCKYSVQLGRKFKEYPNITKENQQIVREENINFKNDYIEIVNSNTLEAPNDHILFENLNSRVLYRNVKTNQEIRKDLGNMIAKTYNVYDLYKIIYKDEMDSAMFDLNNPSSAGNPSSSISSSLFK